MIPASTSWRHSAQYGKESDIEKKDEVYVVI
jgi:hypothetical protein